MSVKQILFNEWKSIYVVTNKPIDTNISLYIKQITVNYTYDIFDNYIDSVWNVLWDITNEEDISV